MQFLFYPVLPKKISVTMGHPLNIKYCFDSDLGENGFYF